MSKRTFFHDIFDRSRFCCILLSVFLFLNIELTSLRTDTDAEIELIQKLSKEAGAFDAVACSHWADGGIKFFTDPFLSPIFSLFENALRDTCYFSLAAFQILLTQIFSSADDTLCIQ